MAKHVRMPTAADVDEYGMVLIQVNTKNGPKIKRLPAVDAREIILAEEGTLDIGEEVSEAQTEAEQRLSVFASMDINALRDLAEAHDLPYKGRTVVQLAKELADSGGNCEDAPA